MNTRSGFIAGCGTLTAQFIRGGAMDLSPGEKAVLGQIRCLYQEAARDQLLTALRRQWPPTHYQTYSDAYSALVAKRLIQQTSAQTFELTDMGLTAIGAAQSRRAPIETGRKEPRQPPAVGQVEQPKQVVSKTGRSVMSRLVAGLLGQRS